jgi:predicted DNA-binding transcriptional regulator AlpA
MRLESKSADIGKGKEVMMYVDYHGLVSKGVFNSRMTLWRAIRDHGFPPGILITPNRRAWTEDEVGAWIALRPTAPKAGTPSARIDRIKRRALDGREDPCVIREGYAQPAASEWDIQSSDISLAFGCEKGYTGIAPISRRDIEMIEQDVDQSVADARGWLQAIVDMVGRYNEAFESDNDKKLNAAELEISEAPLRFDVRSDWYSPEADADKTPFEYRIVLPVGARVVQLTGFLSEDGEPETANLEYQGWSEPWRILGRLTEEQSAALLCFAQRFDFGE